MSHGQVERGATARGPRHRSPAMPGQDVFVVLSLALEAAREAAGATTHAGLWDQAQVLAGQQVSAVGLDTEHDCSSLTVIAGAVAAHTLRLRARQDDDLESSVRVATDAAMPLLLNGDGVARTRASLSLQLALTYADPHAESTVRLQRVARILATTRGTALMRACAAAAHLVVRDHSANHPHLGSAWAAVCGEQLLGLLAQGLNELGVPPVGKPPIRAQGIRRAQKSTVQQLAATGLCPNATLHHLARVNRRTVIAWLSEPSPRPASVRNPPMSLRCSRSATRPS